MTSGQLRRLSTVLVAVGIVAWLAVVALVAFTGRDDYTDAEWLWLVPVSLVPVAILVAALVAQDRSYRP